MNEGQYVLPNPYPDELLYSIVTRYHLRMNNTSPKWTLREIYGTENVIPTIDLPSHIEDLTQRNVLQDISADYLIDQHTFYPFYSPFLPENRAKRLRQLMKGKDGSGIHTLAGITASSVERSDRLRFCSSCYEHDIDQFGEPYWHRVHQLPGVLICPVHHSVLNRITYPISDRHGLTVLPISKSMFQSVPVVEDLHDKILNRLSEIAMDIQLLLQTDNVPILYDSRGIFLSRLMELGFVTAGGRIRQQKLEEQFITFYSRNLLLMLESLPQRNDFTWLALATRSARRAIRPLRQMIFIRFLYGSFSAFLADMNLNYAPFGKEPWPCLNKAAEHYSKPVIKECQITRCSDTGRPVGTFICECGFIYSRRGPDQSEDDKFRRGRIKAFGPVWANKLQECIQIGLSFRSSAKILGVDTNTVIKYAKGAAIDFKIQSRNTKRLKKTFNSNRPKNYKNIRVDLEKRDLELSWKVEEACKAILAENDSKPIRITVATIGKRIGKLSWLEKNKQKLPVTMAILSNYLENVSQFQIRRVRWAAKEMRGEWPLKRWKLIKKAGLRPGYSSDVSEELDRCISHSMLSYHSPSIEVIQSWLH